MILLSIPLYLGPCAVRGFIIVRLCVCWPPTYRTILHASLKFTMLLRNSLVQGCQRIPEKCNSSISQENCNIAEITDYCCFDCSFLPHNVAFIVNGFASCATFWFSDEWSNLWTTFSCTCMYAYILNISISEKNKCLP